MAQYGFFFDQSRCSGYRACAVACKSWNGLPPGTLKYLRVYEYEKGSFPSVCIHFQWVPCYHCEEPVCLSSCPCDAMYKEEKYGAVLIDSEKCNGCRLCYESCPYGSPVFESDKAGVKAQKCTMCIDRLELGQQPVCVLSCPTRALDFGQMNSMTEIYGENRDLDDLPCSLATKPAVLFKPRNKKRKLVTYDNEKAIKLMMTRNQLPQVFASATDVTDLSRRIVGRSALVIKHGSADELMRYTRSDEG